MFVGRLAIPYIGPRGNVYGMRFRVLDDSEPKYLGMPGLETRLYNLRALARADDLIVICEGELDALSCSAAGVPAVGVPGVENWKTHHHRLFDGIERIFIAADADTAGKKMRDRLLGEIPWAQPVTLDPGTDMNDLLRKEGPDGVRQLFP